MRADEIGLIAKKDPLICNYAYSYLKGRKSKGNLDLVRQDMRRLAKLLKFARHENTDIKDLIDLLRPCFFQIIIKCVSKIGCYNSETDMFESPTVAINFGTLLKKCCDLAYIHLIQKPNTNDQRKEVKVLKTLVTSQWANEISAQASTNLNSKKWNKEDLLPLTSDLVKLNNFLKATAEDMYDKLKTDETNSLAYNCLKDVLYIQIILLNRKRPAEVAQLKVETYKSINLDYKGINEFESCLTEIEKMLLSSYSRIVIRGKRGRGVPILLSKNMKKYFDLLVEVRDNYINGNDYIFHTNGRNCIDGTKILYKYAKKCGVQYPEYINATRLRKHLATITQLLQFSEKDLEQLAKFMGHTLNIHCNTYRLSDNLYQTAKVSKLLLLASEGGIEQYKGMNLDDINMDLNPISEEHDRVEDIIAEVNEKTIRDSQLPYEDTIQVDNTEHATTQFIETKTEAVKKTPTPKQSWTVEQKKIIFNHFFSHIESKRAPKLHEVKEFQEKYPDKFKHRKWTSIKAVVFNIYTNKLKM
ncbi:uncharacterized protein LOC111691497 [Anoplophora glabripennis]|uniref:uncharacterized protein LOC111691497 n=1 Tax=Anoplophora glabripennis TaxID=217634 RepID=UPI000C76A71B|nr:uncharacterized protein LOC111691497 [Anoplophora glabripennis]